VFDRKSSTIVEMRQFDDARAALAARLDAEASYSDRPSVEVVVLNAESKDAPRRTHLRYFEKFNDIAAQALNRWATSAG
ncbi:MAG: hypothetical protein ACRD0H_07355, partial [Actinomycetes bacterium]